MSTKKKFSSFETSKLTKKSFNNVKGGCTAGTNNVCHIDGTIDFTSVK
jgi:hypothetical protein